MKEMSPYDFFAIKEMMEEDSYFACAGCLSPINSDHNKDLELGAPIDCPICGDSHAVYNPFSLSPLIKVANYSGYFGLGYNYMADVMRVVIASGLNFPLRIPQVPKTKRPSKGKIIFAFVHGKSEEDNEEEKGGVSYVEL